MNRKQYRDWLRSFRGSHAPQTETTPSGRAVAAVRREHFGSFTRGLHNYFGIQ